MSDFIDCQLICLNGHQINTSFHKESEKNKEHCEICGEKTINKCINCETEIPGDIYYEFVGAADESPKVPQYCVKCGFPFPWKNKKQPLNRKKSGNNNLEKKTDSDSKKEDKMYLDKIKNNPIVVAGICFITGFSIALWLSEEFRIKPKNDFISQLDNNITRLKEEKIELHNKLNNLKSSTSKSSSLNLDNDQYLFIKGLKKYQEDNKLNKVYIRRDGRLYHDSLNVIELFLKKDIKTYSIKQLDSLIHSLPQQYIKIIPEARLGSPYVLKLTKEAEKEINFNSDKK